MNHKRHIGKLKAALEIGGFPTDETRVTIKYVRGNKVKPTSHRVNKTISDWENDGKLGMLLVTLPGTVEVVREMVIKVSHCFPASMLEDWEFQVDSFTTKKRNKPFTTMIFIRSKGCSESAIIL